MPEQSKKQKINWGKLILLTVVNSAFAAIGGTSIGESIGIITSNPKNSLKLAAIGAALGASNLLITVTKEVFNEKFLKESD